jgi:DNA repair protein RecO (recombination protein O)
MGWYKTEGVVLRRRNLGEADRLVTVLTRDRGKLTVAARGARRPKSRLGGRLEPAVRVRALVAEGRTLDLISQVEVLDARAALRRDLDRMGVVSVLLELADRALADRHPHPDAYRLLLQALDLVESSPAGPAWPWFAARLLVATGHRPTVTQCAVCGRRLRGNTAWSVLLGGCVHPGCAARDPHASTIPQAAAALLGFLLDAGPAALLGMSSAPRELALVSDLLRSFAEAAWDARLRAPGILRRMQPGAAANADPARD